jgi:hypothetical protein
MRWRTAGKRIQTLMILLALIFAAVLGYEFYAPLIGRVATGDEQEAKPAVPRDRAAVKVEAYMASQSGHGLPTLADVVRFYGLENDTIACAVQENDGEAASPAAISALMRRPLKIGDEVILCLD